MAALARVRSAWSSLRDVTGPVVTGYSNSELATRYLLSDGEFSLHGFVELNDNHTWAAFTQLESAVREGSCPDQWAMGETPLQVASPRGPPYREKDGCIRDPQGPEERGDSERASVVGETAGDSRELAVTAAVAVQAPDVSGCAAPEKEAPARGLTACWTFSHLSTAWPL